MEEPSYVIDVRSILEDLGEIIALDADVMLPTLVVGTQEFVPLADAHLAGTLTNTGAGVVLSATLDVAFRAECSRCLKEFSLPVSVDVDGFYVAHGSEHDLPEEQEVGFIEEGAVDVMPAMLSAILLELPFAPLHDENCQGICPVCGADRNEQSCECSSAITNSPFAALKDLFPAE